jgi:glycosyltransferase involved in cell wall biosynthesis
MRIFFSGDSKGYTRSRVRYPHPKLPRQAILLTALERLGDDALRLRDPALLKAPDGAYLHQCVIADPDGVWIDAKDWLATLAQADFFLSPPGIVMPMCHNIVEAMAVGTIPITNYPEWFVPPLQDGHNCIVFDGHDDLIAKLRLAMNLSASDIARMKQHAIDYYEQHLRPEHFVRAIETRADRTLTLLLYTERNVARNAARLGRHSVLFRPPGRPAWKRLLPAALGGH